MLLKGLWAQSRLRPFMVLSLVLFYFPRLAARCILCRVRMLPCCCNSFSEGLPPFFWR